MEVFRATPIRAQDGSAAVYVEKGYATETPYGVVVETVTGRRTPLNHTWHHSRYWAWTAAADTMDRWAADLHRQAEGCRQRAAEEVMS